MKGRRFWKHFLAASPAIIENEIGFSAMSYKSQKLAHQLHWTTKLLKMIDSNHFSNFLFAFRYWTKTTAAAFFPASCTPCLEYQSQFWEYDIYELKKTWFFAPTGRRRAPYPYSWKLAVANHIFLIFWSTQNLLKGSQKCPGANKHDDGSNSVRLPRARRSSLGWLQETFVKKLHLIVLRVSCDAYMQGEKRMSVVCRYMVTSN